MADIASSPSAHRRRKTLRPLRMDMTPMVDLAFLLLTFFILTTSLRRLQGLELIAPLNRHLHTVVGARRRRGENTPLGSLVSHEG